MYKRQASDCEPPLHIYRTAGADFAASLRGMYAIAIYDPAEARLLLARDPFGIKPLYLTRTERFFAFASEPRAFFAAGLLAPEIAPAPLGEMLQLQFTTGEETPFAGVSRLRPGEALIVSRGRVVERRTRPALPADPPRAVGEDEALAELDRVFLDSVAVHQRSDVPYGMFPVSYTHLTLPTIYSV